MTTLEYHPARPVDRTHALFGQVMCDTAGSATRRDLSRLARFSLWALAALIAFGVVLIFV